MGAENRLAFIRDMSDTVPVEQFEHSKSELLTVNPASIVDLAANLSEIADLIVSGELDPFTVFRNAAVLNEQSPLPRAENIGPYQQQVVGELFPQITLRDEQGHTVIESLRYVHVGEDPGDKGSYLGPKNMFFDNKWWERVCWRKYTGPFSQAEVDDIEEAGASIEIRATKTAVRSFAPDSKGGFWEVENLEGHFKKPTEEEMIIKEYILLPDPFAADAQHLERPTYRDYKETLQIAKPRQEAVRIAIDSLLRETGRGRQIAPVPSGEAPVRKVA